MKFLNFLSLILHPPFFIYLFLLWLSFPDYKSESVIVLHRVTCPDCHSEKKKITNTKETHFQINNMEVIILANIHTSCVISLTRPVPSFSVFAPSLLSFNGISLRVFVFYLLRNATCYNFNLYSGGS